MGSVSYEPHERDQLLEDAGVIAKAIGAEHVGHQLNSYGEFVIWLQTGMLPRPAFGQVEIRGKIGDRHWRDLVALARRAGEKPRPSWLSKLRGMFR